MESTYQHLFRDVCPGVVLVGRFDYFCVGSVLQSEEDEDTFILTQSSVGGAPWLPPNVRDPFA